MLNNYQEKDFHHQRDCSRKIQWKSRKFDTNRLAQTVSRSDVLFLMARDIAKKSNKENKIADHVTGKRRQSHE